MDEVVDYGADEAVDFGGAEAAEAAASAEPEAAAAAPDDAADGERSGEEEGEEEHSSPPPAPRPALRSRVARPERTDVDGRVLRGRAGVAEAQLAHTGSVLVDDEPAKSVEGWLVIVTGCNEEAQEDDVYERFADYGEIQNLHVNLDRRTGLVKGYALVEYARREDAQEAISSADGTTFMDRVIRVDWAFRRGPTRSGGAGDRDDGDGDDRRRRGY